MIGTLMLAGLLMLPVQRGDDWCVERGMRLAGTKAPVLVSGRMHQVIRCAPTDEVKPSWYPANPDFPQWQPATRRRAPVPGVTTRLITINGRMITVRTYGR